MDARRLRYIYDPLKRRPKTLRCERCKRKILVKSKGPLPSYCSHACRQRAYERNKWERPHLAHLRQDLNSATIRAAVRQEAWALLKQAGLPMGSEPPPAPARKRPSPQLVKSALQAD
jgi:DNA-directed RNA polymerase subunit RPC12/RpoP